MMLVGFQSRWSIREARRREGRAPIENNFPFSWWDPGPHPLTLRPLCERVVASSPKDDQGRSHVKVMKKVSFRMLYIRWHLQSAPRSPSKSREKNMRKTCWSWPVTSLRYGIECYSTRYGVRCSLQKLYRCGYCSIAYIGSCSWLGCPSCSLFMTSKFPHTPAVEVLGSPSHILVAAVVRSTAAPKWNA